MTKSLINLLYPLHCASCGRHLESANDTGACSHCLSQIKRNPLPYCPSCGRSTQNAGEACRECVEMRPFFSQARSCCIYEGCMKELVHKFKYNNKRILADIFTEIMLDFIKDNPGITDGVKFITFVPLHNRRLNERSFNQSELLASNIGKGLRLPILAQLEKTRFTKNQNELSRDERLLNVIGAFKIKRNNEQALIKGSAILIIDDVMTTGATLNEASRVLVEAGAGNVRCLTLARGT